MTNGVDPKTGIWSMELARKRHKCDLGLAFGIAMLYEDRVPLKAADVGCGNGRYCAILKACGWPYVVGYEGTHGVLGLGVYDPIVYLDLTKPVLHFAETYDVVLFLEVAEHVPIKHEQTMLRNVCDMVKEGGTLVMSWAPPGQYSASGHVNPRLSDYVSDTIRDLGFVYRSSDTALLSVYAVFEWFKRNLTVWRKT